MITFTRTVPNVSPSGQAGTPTVTTIPGEGVIVGGIASQYEGLGLDESMSPTVLFTPTGYPQRAFTDDTVKRGDTCVINSKVFTAQKVFVTAPDGFVVIARVIVSL